MQKLVSIVAFGFLNLAIYFSGATLVRGASPEDGLYDTPIPDDAVFVRWLGDTGPSTVFGYTFPKSHIGPTYVAVSSHLLVGTTSGEFYSILSEDGAAPIVIPEPRRSDRSKVYLFLVNAGKIPAWLVVAGQNIEVIGATPSQIARVRAVNPVAVQLAVAVDGGTRVLAQFDLNLRRGQNLTFFIRDDRVELVENRFGPVLEKRE